MIYTPGEKVVGGVRCRRCGKFTAVAEGNAIYLCCSLEGTPRVDLSLEHHTWECIDGKDHGKRCPCNERRLVEYYRAFRES